MVEGNWAPSSLALVVRVDLDVVDDDNDDGVVFLRFEGGEFRFSS